jgi:hypothetical protein
VVTSTVAGSAAAWTRAATLGAPPHFAGPLDHDGPGIETDAGRELRRALGGVSRVQLGEGALDRERRAHCALGVVLLSLRIAEQRHQSVAEPLQHMTA